MVEASWDMGSSRSEVTSEIQTSRIHVVCPFFYLPETLFKAQSIGYVICALNPVPLSFGLMTELKFNTRNPK